MTQVIAARLSTTNVPNEGSVNGLSHKDRWYTRVWYYSDGCIKNTKENQEEIKQIFSGIKSMNSLTFRDIQNRITTYNNSSRMNLRVRQFFALRKALPKSCKESDRTIKNFVDIWFSVVKDHNENLVTKK